MLKKDVRVGLVTSNKEKYLEMREIAEKFGLNLEWIVGEKVEIQSNNLEEISRHSAIFAYLNYRRPLIVDDSGLFIRALNNFPGPYTSFVKRTIGNEGILKLMNGVNDRYAYFMTVITFTDGRIIKSFTGIVEGSIAYEMRGEKGFGFDPIFIPQGEKRTFGEMSLEEKNMYSHRAKAFTKFVEFICNYV